MKISKLFLLLAIGAFSVSSCTFTLGDTTTYTSEGSISSPVELFNNTSHAGQVDSINSSYYVHYASVYTTYYIDVTGITGDVDLYVYDNSAFSTPYDSSVTTGTASEYATYITTSFYSTIYIEVRPFTASDYSIIVYY